MKDELSLSPALMDHESVVKMLTVLFPCTLRKPLPNSNDLMTPVTRFHLAQVFRENNQELRQKFFKEPLIKHLWSKIFIKECSETCVAHLRRIRSDSKNGETKYNRIWSDMKQVEHKFNFQMLPDLAKTYENTKIFSFEEKEADTYENAKYNKK